MDRFDALSAFVAVAEHEGFAKAARAIKMSPPAITRIIAALEQTLGVSLFHRSTRSVRLTEDGLLLLDRAREMLQQWRETEHLMMGRRDEPRGELYLTAPVLFGRLYVLPVITRLLAEHPAMTVRMLLLDRNIRLVEEGIDVAVRIGPLVDSSLMRVSIGEVRQVIVASPDYLARFGAPQTPDYLAGHHLIEGEHTRTAGQWRFGTKSETAVTVSPRLTANSLDGVIAAAKAGVGLANLLSYQVSDAIAEGSLSSVLDDAAPPPLPVNLLFPANRAKMPAVRCSIDAMRAGRANKSE